MTTPTTLLTTDAFKSAWLERMLGNNTASYKYYWLRALFDESLLYHGRLSFERLAARMVASAWYPVLCYRLRLGSRDALADAVAYAQQACGLARWSSEGDILKALASSNDVRLHRMLQRLCDYVPYRLIRPFYTERINREMQGACVPDRLVNGLVIRFNSEDMAGAPYRFLPDGSGIELDPEWMAYFRDNRLYSLV